MNKVPRWVFRYVGNKTFDFSSKKKDFLPKNDQIWPKIGIFGQFGPGHAGLFSALLVGRLVVVARGTLIPAVQSSWGIFLVVCFWDYDETHGLPKNSWGHRPRRNSRILRAYELKEDPMSFSDSLKN